jgi:hypothetical protein
LNVVTYFSWYNSPEEFECMSARPLEGWFDSADTKRIQKHFTRLKRNGFDAIAPVVFASPSRDVPGAKHMQKMLLALDIAERRGLQFIPLFDMAVASSKSLGFCLPSAQHCNKRERRISEFNLDRHPDLVAFLVDMLEIIADEFILPYADLRRPARSTARFLTDENGVPILDEAGLPRPEIYFYLARLLEDDSRYATLRRLLVEVDRSYAERGLGRPAFTLDVVEPGPQPFEVELVDAFGDRAVAVTSFFATRSRARDLGELAREIHRPMFETAAKELAHAIDLQGLDPRVQVAVGTAGNFDKRKWAECNKNHSNIAWPANGPEDVVDAFLTAFDLTTRPKNACAQNARSEPPYRNKRVIYAGEGFESTWLCAEKASDGRRVFPNKYGCEPLHIYRQLLQGANAP